MVQVQIFYHGKIIFQNESIQEVQFNIFIFFKTSTVWQKYNLYYCEFQPVTEN